MRYKKEMKSLIHSFKYAFQGIWASFKSERNMKIHVFMMILVLIFGFWLKINYSEWMICIILFALVIAAELFNTAIEEIVDMISMNISPQAKLVKDISAGAVLVMAIAASIIGGMIFIPKLFALGIF